MDRWTAGSTGAPAIAAVLPNPKPEPTTLRTTDLRSRPEHGPTGAGKPTAGGTPCTKVQDVVTDSTPEGQARKAQALRVNEGSLRQT
jgi:hypothetical protein